MGLRLRGCLQGHRCVVQSSREVRAIAAATHTFPVIAARRGAVRSREGEEPGTTPGGAGDGACDGREAGDLAVPLIGANEPRAGFELAAGRAAVARQTLQEGQAFPIKAAKGLLL